MKLIIFTLISLILTFNYSWGFESIDNSLIQYIKEGNAEAVQKTLSQGAYINTRDPFTGIPAIKWAVIKGDSQITELLIERGADIDAVRYKNMPTALYIASSHGNIEIVEMLIEAGADINIKVKTPRGIHTPLSIARHRNNNIITEILIKAGASE